MIQVTLNELRPGHVLARTIYRDTGEVLLTAGFRITAEVCQKLAVHEQNYFWVQEEGLEDVQAEFLVSEMVINQSVTQMQKNSIAFRKDLGLITSKPDAPIPSPKEIIESPAKIKAALPTKKYKQIATTLYQEIRRADQSLLHLGGTRTISNFIYQHAVESAIVAGILAKRFNFADSEVEDLMLGALLMDMGQLLLPEHLLTQHGKMTLADFNLQKEHPVFGYEILRSDNTVPLTCAHMALQHHERQDGGGYPRRLMGNNEPPARTVMQKNTIHRYSEIAAVADEYLNLIAPRPIGGALPQMPVQSIKYLLRVAGSKLNQSIVDTLISMVPIYTAGCRIVITEDGEQPERVGMVGVVKHSNPIRQDRPDVILIYDRHGNRIPAQPIDLTLNSGITIREIPPGKIWEPATSDSPLQPIQTEDIPESNDTTQTE
jgi:HD-GYP domain-containing protein (c-di-GMP phosphodiesterase class II)